MKNLPEKRSVHRKKLAQQISFEISIIDAGLLATRVELGTALDLGSGGMGMCTSHPVGAGAVVKVFFPVLEEIGLPVLAQVAWSRPDADGYRAGLRFLN